MPTRLNAAALILAMGAAGCSTHYTATGLVLSATPPSTITISHDAVPGSMDAMTMAFAVSGDARRVATRPGDRVRFRLSVTNGRSSVDRIQILSAAPADAGLTRTPARPVLVAVGDTVPDFTLVDQSSSRVSLASLRGKVVGVTFVYTRCPLPDYCPRMVAHFRAVRARFAGRMGRDLVLLTVSVDPRHDTPARLAQYAAAHEAAAPGWHFLTGAADQIERVCDAFGVQAFPDNGLITHSLQTAVVGRDGRLAGTIEGKDFSARQLGDLIASVLDRGL